MKKLLMIASAIILMVSSVSAQKLVKAGTLVEKNTPWYFGTENASEIVLNAIKAYNNVDPKTYLSYFDDNYVKNNSDRVYKEFATFKAVNRKVNIVIPVRTDGWPNQTEVQIYDNLDREYKNGSKHKQQEHRVYIVNDSSKKISMVWGSVILDDKNEYGLTTGGKYYSKTDTSTITFSNRGEVELIENKESIKSETLVTDDSTMTETIPPVSEVPVYENVELENLKIIFTPSRRKTQKRILIAIEGSLTINHVELLYSKVNLVFDYFDFVEVNLNNVTDIDLTVIQLFHAIRVNYWPQQKFISINAEFSRDDRKLLNT